MAAGMNKVILIGNLGKDPQARDLEGGNLVVSFPLATTEYFKDRNGNREEKTEWHNIVLWRALADYAVKNLRKGSTVMIEGKLRTRSWEDKEKVKHYTTEIVGDHILNLSGQRREENNRPTEAKTGTDHPADSSGDLA